MSNGPACGDAEELPFADSSFDAVLSTYALEHSVNPRQMLREMARIVKPGGRIVLLGPAWDFPFWYPNSLVTRARSRPWLVNYSLARFAAQLAALLGGESPFLIVEEPDAFSQPFIHDADAVYVVWTHEVIRQMKRWGLRLVKAEADNPLLGENVVLRAVKRALMLLPAYRTAGSTILLAFERSA
jgi:SAM-dependent methyltransferase